MGRTQSKWYWIITPTTDLPMRIITAVCVYLILLIGCDSFPTASVLTGQEIAKIRSGDQSFLIHPVATELSANCKDRLVVQNLKEIILTGDLGPYTDSSLLCFDQISKIELYSTHNTDPFLALVSQFPNLTELYIEETDTTNEGIIAVSESKALIGLSVTSWGDKLGLESIKELSNVTTLQQINLQIASQKHDLSNLQNSLPECEIIQTTYSGE